MRARVPRKQVARGSTANRACASLRARACAAKASGERLNSQSGMREPATARTAAPGLQTRVEHAKTRNQRRAGRRRKRARCAVARVRATSFQFPLCQLASRRSLECVFFRTASAVRISMHWCGATLSALALKNPCVHGPHHPACTSPPNSEANLIPRRRPPRTTDASARRSLEEERLSDVLHKAVSGDPLLVSWRQEAEALHPRVGADNEAGAA